MKQECPTYLKSIGKSRALAAMLSDTEAEDDSDNEDDGILNAFTTTVNPPDGIVEEENWWSPSLRRWITKMISIQPMRNYTSFLRNMRNSIG